MGNWAKLPLVLIRPILFAAASANHRFPSGPGAMPSGWLPGGIENSTTSPGFARAGGAVTPASPVTKALTAATYATILVNLLMPIPVARGGWYIRSGPVGQEGKLPLRSLAQSRSLVRHSRKKGSPRRGTWPGYRPASHCRMSWRAATKRQPLEAPTEVRRARRRSCCRGRFTGVVERAAAEPHDVKPKDHAREGTSTHDEGSDRWR